MMHKYAQRGFTLVEMIIVIVITGIIAGMVAMFIRAPVQGYVDSARRAEMSDIADTALRRLGRDLRTAVPNSVRMPTPAGSTYVEFLPTSNGGRYRVNATGGSGGCGAAGDELSFDGADTCFETIGPAIAFTAGDMIVIGSTQSDGSLPYLAVGAASSVRATVTGSGLVGGVQHVTFGTKVFPASSELDGRRFEVVPAATGAVTYACVPPGGGACGTDVNGDGTCQLLRISAYGFNTPQVLPATAGAPVLAQNISFCNFVYDITNQRNSLLAARLKITRGNESVNLYHEVHINNIP